jgi:hypothetical protein
METRNELKARIARLESRLDLVESELTYLNELLQECGFPNGIQTLKATITDLLSEADDLYYPLDNEDDYPPTQTFNPFA